MERKNKIKIIAAFATVIIFVMLWSYQLEKNAAKEKTEMLALFEKTMEKSDSSIRETSNKFKYPLINVTQKCENEKICDIDAAIRGSVLFYFSYVATSSVESLKIITEWSGKKVRGENSSRCAAPSINAISLANTILISEEMLGSGKLIEKQSNFTTTFIERFNASKLKNDSNSIEYIKNNVSIEQNKTIIAHIEEINRNYVSLKDSKMETFSKSVDEKTMSGINKYGTVDKLENYFCGASTSAKIKAYHKEFIAHAYTQFDVLLKEGRYEEALPYANILDGFLSMNVQTK